jgi:hypothetical protein
MSRPTLTPVVSSVRLPSTWSGPLSAEDSPTTLLRKTVPGEMG